MAEIVGAHEGPLAPAGHKGPALAGLEVVVMGAEPVEELEHRAVTSSPVDTVVVLQPGRGGTAFGGTGRVQPLQRGLLVGSRAPAQVGDAEDLGSLVTTAARKGSAVSRSSRRAETATGP